MDRETFYRKLSAGLTHAGFHVQAGGSSQEGLSRERDTTLLAIRQFASIVGSLDVQFDHDAIQRHLDAIRAWARLACFKYTVGQPIVLAAIEADGLSEDQITTLKQRFDRVVLDMLDVTAKLDVGGPGKVRMGSFGILLFVFFEPQAAARFAGRTQRRCKVFHIFMKAYTLPWLVDVAGGAVRKHRGLPFFMASVLNCATLQNDIFGQQAEPVQPG
jgi:hypothetical protein